MHVVVAASFLLNSGTDAIKDVFKKINPFSSDAASLQGLGTFGAVMAVIISLMATLVAL